MEANNMAELREALETTNNLFEHGVICTSYANSAEEMEQVEELYRKAKSALATPARNCDVGTAEEQVERFKEYCAENMQYYRDMCGTHEGAGGWDCREDCPIGKMIDKNDSFCDHCELIWAQMPYEKGERSEQR